jgi:hypothetical protein
MPMPDTGSRHGDYRISSDKSELDLEFIHGSSQRSRTTLT